MVNFKLLSVKLYAACMVFVTFRKKHGYNNQIYGNDKLNKAFFKNIYLNPLCFGS